jgi:hypothetical protein
MLSPVRRFRRFSDLSVWIVTPRRLSTTPPKRFAKPGAGRGLVISSPHDEYYITKKNPGNLPGFPGVEAA